MVKGSRLYVLGLFSLILAGTLACVASVVLSGWSGAAGFNTLFFQIISLYIFHVSIWSIKIRNSQIWLFRILGTLGPLAILIWHNPLKFFVSILVFTAIIGLGAIYIKLTGTAYGIASQFLVGISLISLLLYVSSALNLLNTWLALTSVIIPNLFLCFRLVHCKEAFLGNIKAAFQVERFSPLHKPLYSTVFTIYLACALAPDLLFDSQAMKAWMPRIWAENDRIDLALGHTQSGLLSSMSLLQMLANYLGVSESGSIIQLACLIVVLFLLLQNMEKTSFNFVIVGTLLTIPAFAWQVSGSYDDIWIATLLLCAYVTTLDVVKKQIQTEDLVLLGFAISGLLAGKLTLLPFGLILILYVIFKIFASRSRVLPKIVLFVATSFILSSPPFLQKLIQSGNPVWPTYNGIFRGLNVPEVNISWNLPFGPGDLVSILTSPFRTIVNPSGWVEGSSPGLYSASILVILIVIALSVVNLQTHPELILGFLILSTNLTIWYVQFRYLRYLLPSFIICIYILTRFSSSKFSDFGFSKTLSLFLGGILLIGIPSGIPAVPERVPTSFALGNVTTDEYLSKSVWAYPVIRWMNTNAETNARVLSYSSSFYQRLRLRSDIDLSWQWEISESNIVVPSYLVYDGSFDTLGQTQLFGKQRYCPAIEFKEIQMAIYRSC